MSVYQKIADDLVERFRPAAESLPANDEKRAAFARFSKVGPPHRRVEGWRWSDLPAALRAANGAASSGRSAAFDQIGAPSVNIVNGRIADAQAAAALGVVEVDEWDDTLDPCDWRDRFSGLVDLNTAAAVRQIRVEMIDGAAGAVWLRHIFDSREDVFVSIAMRVGNCATLNVIETFEGRAPFVSHAAIARTGKNASIARTMLQSTEQSVVLHSSFGAIIGVGGAFEQSSVSLGGRFARHETVPWLVDEDARVRIDSVALVDRDRHADFTSHVAHDEARAITRQRHKGVVDGNGRAVFQGKFLVGRSAQKTDAEMQANALLLSDRAQANHKPELEIYADDVQCAHGSTSGALDDDALFYLRQRGLDEGAARALLIEAFVGELIGDMDAAARPAAAELVGEWLRERTA
ncbi:MAG: hypothetical protein GC152_14415 [Alphaproteobacteria bacterium]|nr:hypothetical protein [Alphaproteobacteria bacterium]